jgi:hypothetical protein
MNVNGRVRTIGGSTTASAPTTAPESSPSPSSYNMFEERHVVSNDPPPFVGTGRMAGVRPRFPGMETWVSACFAEFETNRAKWAPYDAKHRARFDEIKKLTGYYEQRDAFKELANAYRGDVKAAGLKEANPFQNLLAQSGFPYEVSAYMMEQDRKRGILHERGEFSQPRPAIHDDMLAGDVYCANEADRARSTGACGQKVCGADEYYDMLPAARIQAVQKYRDSWSEDHTFDPVDVPSITDHDHPYDDDMMAADLRYRIVRLGRLAYLGGIVDRITTSAHGTELRLLQSNASGSWHDCVETNKIDHVDDNGHIAFQRNCELSVTKERIMYTATFSEVPTGIRKGDWVDFTGVVKKATSTGKGGTVVLDAMLLTRLARAKKKGDEPRNFEILKEY